MAKTSREQVQHDVEHDFIAEELNEGIHWIVRHRFLLLGLLALFVVTMIGSSIYRGARARTLRESNALMGRAMSAYNNMMLTGDQQVAAENARAVMEYTDSLMDAYPGSRLALEGAYLRGATHYAQDNFAEAQTAYQQYVDNAPTNLLKARGEIALGYSYENESFLSSEQGSKDQLDKLEIAFAHYDAARRLSPSPSYLYFYALLGQARIHELRGEYDDAIAIYDTILAERPALESAGDVEPPAHETQMMGLIRQMVDSAEQPISFASTAELRLERLRGITGTAAPQAEGPASGPESPAAETPAEATDATTPAAQ